MDYGRIYRDFIADRRRIEPTLEGYTEKHHILPRALGGGNEAENLIRLTAEDHFFAHLLLAKIHGGRMWAAVYAMAYLANDAGAHAREKFRSRLRFGHVRSALADYYRSILSGPDGKIADQTICELRHMDGRVAKGNRFRLSEQTGLDRQRISAVLGGRQKTARGWYSPIHNPKGQTGVELSSNAIASKDVLRLFHHDGREWSGTQREFQKEFGVKYVRRGPESGCYGWYLSPEMAKGHAERRRLTAARASRARGSISGNRNPMAGADRRKRCMVSVVHKDGRRFNGCLTALADELGLNASQYRNFRKVLDGRRIVAGFQVKSFHGWRASS